jgi:calcineurin-like phosphoesterase family protein
MENRIFVISDTHFNHKNVIAYCNRPFSSVEEMNTSLIKSWNDAVSDNDIVVFCGDFCLAAYDSKNKAAEKVSHWASMLNGRKIIVKGNHDNLKVDYTTCGFVRQAVNILRIGDFVFVHDLSKVKGVDINPSCDAVFYGHIHNKDYSFELPPSYMNVCVERIAYKPFDITDRIPAFNRKLFEEAATPEHE